MRQKKDKVYISGKISGLAREEYLAQFAMAERLLKEQGYKVLNPTRLPPCRWLWVSRLLGYRLTLLYDLWMLSRCSLIYKMPGWRDSGGANIESCWAYHFKIWPVSAKEREKIDKRLAKYAEKRKTDLNTN